jgi:hypothetical protein
MTCFAFHKYLLQTKEVNKFVQIITKFIEHKYIHDISSVEMGQRLSIVETTVFFIIYV